MNPIGPPTLALWQWCRLLGATRKNWTTVLFVCKMKNKKQIQHADLEIAIGRRRWWRGNYTKPSELTISYAFFFLISIICISAKTLQSTNLRSHMCELNKKSSVFYLKPDLSSVTVQKAEPVLLNRVSDHFGFFRMLSWIQYVSVWLTVTRCYDDWP